jgi:hypothetical protein
MPTVSGRFELIYYVNINAIGAGGGVRCHLRGQITNIQNGLATLTHIVRVDAPAVDFTVSQTFDITAQWGTASASNFVFLSGVTIERIR